jgi:hypothetical protein
VTSRVPAKFTEGNLTYKGSALLSGDSILFQANVDLPKSSGESKLPPGVPITVVTMAGVSLPFIWLRRKQLNPRYIRVATNLLIIALVVLVSTGCFGMGMYGSATVDAKINKIEYVGGQDTGMITVSENLGSPPTGKPLWKLAGTGTYDVTFSIESTVTDLDGKDTTTVETCTGKVTYPITGYVYKDFQVQIPDN